MQLGKTLKETVVAARLPRRQKKCMEMIESRLAMIESAVAVESDDEGNLFKDSDEEPSNSTNKALVRQTPKRKRKKVGFPTNP